MWVGVCVCVIERERERERDGQQKIMNDMRMYFQALSESTKGERVSMETYMCECECVCVCVCVCLRFEGSLQLPDYRPDCRLSD